MVGVDGCKDGWIAIEVPADGQPGPPVAHHLRTIGDLDAACPAAAVVAVDMPIGLPMGPGWRAADLAARHALGPRRSTLFPIGVQAAMDATTHAEATAISVNVTTKGLSRQSYALRHKIREVADWLGGRTGVFEVHPELSFCAMAGGTPLASSKKAWTGLWDRLALLRAEGIDLGALAGEPGAAGTDDVVDAAAAAWTARRLLRGEALRHPAEPPADDPWSIWA